MCCLSFDMQIILTLLNGVWSIFKIVLIPVGALLVLATLLIFGYFLVYYLKGRRLQKGEHVNVRRPGFFKSFFYLFPHRFISDLFDKNPEFFSHQGCIVFTGRQGAGKTVAMVEQALLWQKEYPKSKCITNLAYLFQDDELDHWQKLIDYKNGIQGVICLMDEMQNWFSSNQSKNFPPEMLQVITQNRKNRRVIMGTAQSFNRLAKPLREQATEVRRCLTLFGCLTFVHRVEPELDSSGEVVKWKHRGFYYFVHTDEIRESYDTYRVIEALRASGFQDRAPDLSITVRQ